jgi:hypothetical protein
MSRSPPHNDAHRPVVLPSYGDRFRRSAMATGRKPELVRSSGPVRAPVTNPHPNLDHRTEPLIGIVSGTYPTGVNASTLMSRASAQAWAPATLL